MKNRPEAGRATRIESRQLCSDGPMQRKAWFEIHDHRLFPGFLRDLVTDALEAMWNARDIYGPLAPRLERALAESGTRRVVDLCSGGGGPWIGLSRCLSECGD